MSRQIESRIKRISKRNERPEATGAMPRGAIRPIWSGDARSLSRLSRRGQRLDNYWQTL